MNTTIIITYDFFYHEDSSPWFCSYSTTVIVDDKVVHGELIQLSELEEFERLRAHALEGDFNKESEYTNPHSGVSGETYRKMIEAE